MYIPTILKYSTEVIPINVIFSQWLRNGEILSGNTVTAIDQDGNDESSLFAPASYNDTTATVICTGGTAGDEILVTFTTTTSAGSTYVAHVLVKVR